ncbi:MAG: 50S ribosomal protein L10 [Lewinellaceae bacterium]|nr:50S ribosomal protein L10 [Saprospiraceae bacterium]MCB9339683.1 50S ribosomal protein L10 [Lewinellaceae bacterium]
MTKAEKTAVIEELKEKFAESPFFYLADSSAMTVAQVNTLRRQFYEKGIEMRVVKNTLAQKALEAIDGGDKNYAEIFEALKGPTAVLFADVANMPAKIIKDFRKGKDDKKPSIKAAYIDSAIYIGDDQLEALANLKSKEDLLGELIGLLNSPMSNLLSQLNSGGQNVMGLLKALEERG